MDELYTINQAAIILKVHPLTVRRYIREGKLKALRAGGNIRVSLNDLRAFTQAFIIQTRAPRSQSAITEKSFSTTDPLFRLKGRGISMRSLEGT